MLAVSVNTPLTEYNSFQLGIYVFLCIFVKLEFFFANIANALFLAKIGKVTSSKRVTRQSQS